MHLARAAGTDGRRTLMRTRRIHADSSGLIALCWPRRERCNANLCATSIAAAASSGVLMRRTISIRCTTPAQAACNHTSASKGTHVLVYKQAGMHAATMADSLANAQSHLPHEAAR